MSSKYRGVRRMGGKWQVQIMASGRSHHLGMFVDEVEAARAYDAAAVELQERPRLNFPPEPEDRTRIPLGNGKYAIIDEDMCEYLSQWPWSCKGGYALRKERGHTVLMHREVVGNVPSELCVDHISGDGLDNRKCNLRVVTHAQNMSNRTRRTDNKSGLKCVWWRSDKRKWQPQIVANGKKHFLGYFDNPIAAALAYDRAAAELHGDFAKPNFDREETPEGVVLRPNAADIFRYLTR
ncbi:HNH endonuclease [Aeoliella sp.]|uniref:HNH endonuclease n=1 Tax=Aeoliella sp. TaxID=2795800 RepID=UPI003CCB8BAC